MATIKPLGDHILIRRLEAEAKTAGGILLPDAAREKPAEGTVEAVGDGRLLDNGTRAPFQVAAGDRVIFSSYAGSTVKYGGTEFLLMREEDVLAVVR
jgi:chaperonin GroES